MAMAVIAISIFFVGYRTHFLFLSLVCLSLFFCLSVSLFSLSLALFSLYSLSLSLSLSFARFALSLSFHPHQRRVWLSWDAARIHWAEPDAPATKDSTIRVEDILRIDAGAKSKVFGGSLASAELASTAVQNACFTIVATQRTLDLQVCVQFLSECGGCA
jgi:hypothetical protein